MGSANPTDGGSSGIGCWDVFTEICAGWYCVFFTKYDFDHAGAADLVDHVFRCCWWYDGMMDQELRRETPFRMDRDLLPRPMFGANKSLSTIKLDSYDDSTPLETHLAKLDNCASYYNWSGRDRLCHLKTSLSGQA